MNDNFLPFARPDIGDEEINDVISVLRSGWLTTGPYTRDFEAAFSEWLGGNIQTIAVNSATAGLHLALEAIGIQPGDEIITTTHTFTATAEVIRYLGADPVFVDIDPKTLCLDSTQVEKKITSKTKAIIPVHFAGRSADMKSLFQLAKNKNLRIIEDAAHALPSTYCKKLIGTLESDVTVFSFYSNKTITTGEGGMIATRNTKIANRVTMMRLHGINRNVFDRFTSKKASWRYEIIAPGFKYNMTDIAASIGINQLKKAFLFQEKRSYIANRYNEAFKHIDLQLPPQPPLGEIHSWHLYIILLSKNANISRDNFIELMFNRGIGCSVHYIPLHLHPYWKNTYQLSKKDFPISQDVYERCISLPIYPTMTDFDINRVICAVKDILNEDK